MDLLLPPILLYRLMLYQLLMATPPASNVSSNLLLHLLTHRVMEHYIAVGVIGPFAAPNYDIHVMKHHRLLIVGCLRTFGTD